MSRNGAGGYDSSGTGSDRRTTGEQLKSAIPGAAEHDSSRTAGHGGSQGYSGNQGYNGSQAYGGSQGYSGSQGQEYDTRSTLPSSTHGHGGYSGSQGTGSDRHQHGASAAGKLVAAAHAHLTLLGRQHSEFADGSMPALLSCASAAQM